MTTNQKQGEELNQLSRLLFDKAAGKWYWGIFFEILAGVLGVIIGVLNLAGDIRLLLTISGALFLGLRYFLKLWFENIYDRAETMRRQSISSESLDWPIGQTQFSEWRLKAGKKILDKFKLKPRDVDYYATQQPAGPKRLLETTWESAFWTRNLYTKISQLLWILFGLSVTGFILIISIACMKVIPGDFRFAVVYILYLFFPLFLAIDFFGWAFRLNKLSTEIKNIENGLETLSKTTDVTEAKVMRLVSEYNCQVIQGFPIHNYLFGLWHDEIQELWNKR